MASERTRVLMGTARPRMCARVMDKDSSVDTMNGFMEVSWTLARERLGTRDPGAPMTARGWLAAVGVVLAVTLSHAQTIPSARVAVLLADERGAATSPDLATLRTGARSSDEQTARAAIRALGRLGRPALIPDLVTALRRPIPEARVEAAHAIASSFSRATAGSGKAPSAPGSKPAAGAVALATSVANALSVLLARLDVETEPSVRAAICEALARIPFTNVGQITRVEAALLGVANSDVVAERLGVVRGLESLMRLNVGRWSPAGETIAMLRQLVGIESDHHGEVLRTITPSVPAGPSRDARVRRLALEMLTRVGAVDGAVLELGSLDADVQVRWLAMRAAGAASVAQAETAAPVLLRGLKDAQPTVRMEALRGESVRAKGTPVSCQHLTAALGDSDTRVALVALDLLSHCGASPNAVDALEKAVADSGAASPRGWHRPAHALVALATASPTLAKGALGRFVASPTPYLRAYAARAAVVLNDRATLERLATDADADVSRIASEALGVARTPDLASGQTLQSDITADNLRRFAAPRARVTIRGVGSFDVALLTAEAPATVLRFARLADAGYFDGLALGGPSPTLMNLVPRAAGSADLDGIRPETGPWPHVRGGVGLSATGDGTGDARIFIDLVDNPSFDHVLPVFAHVLNGLDVVDQLLEGDVIERIEVITGP